MDESDIDIIPEEIKAAFRETGSEEDSVTDEQSQLESSGTPQNWLSEAQADGSNTPTTPQEIADALFGDDSNLPEEEKVTLRREVDKLAAEGYSTAEILTAVTGALQQVRE